MSAPQTNIETQKRWHRAPLIGFVAVVLFALVLLFWQMIMVADGASTSDSPSTPLIDQTDAVPEGPADPPLVPDGDLPAPATPAPAPDLPTQPLPDTSY